MVCSFKFNFKIARAAEQLNLRYAGEKVKLPNLKQKSISRRSRNQKGFKKIAQRINPALREPTDDILLILLSTDNEKAMS